MAQSAPLRSRLFDIALIVLGLPRPFTSFDIMLHEAMADLSPVQLATVRAGKRSVDAVMERAFEAAARQGEIATADPILAAHAFIALLALGQVQGHAARPKFPATQKTAGFLVDMLWRGLAPASR